MSNPVASVEIAAKSTGLAASLREARAQFGRFADGVKSTMTRAWDSAATRMRAKGGIFGKGGTAGNVVTGIGQGIGQRVMGGVEEAIGSTLEFEKALGAFGVAARKTPAEMDDIRKAVAATSKATGTSRLEILQGRRALVDLAGASADSDEMMNMLAQTSKATGAEMSDVVGTVYALRGGMKVTDAEMKATLSGLVNMSKDGAVHFNQLAQELTSVAPQFANFGVTGRQGAIELGALFQVTRDGFKDATETATGLSGIFKGLGLHAARFAEAGVKVFNISTDGTKTFKPLSEIFKEIDHSVLAKNPDFLMKAFGRGEGYRAYDMIRKRKEKYEELIRAGQVATTIEEDYQRVIDSPAGKIERAMNSIKLAVAAAFTPERIEAFANAIEGLADKLGPVIDGIGKIGSVLGGAYAVGRNVRGALSKQPFATSDEDEWTASSLGAIDLDWQRQHGGEKHGSKSMQLIRAKLARDRIAAAKRGQSAAGSIMDAENDEKSTPESVRRAVFAANSFSDGNSDYAGGAAAGQRYLRALNVNEEAQQKVIAAALREALSPAVSQLQVIANAVRDNVDVKIGSDPVATASKNAAQHRRGVAK